MQKLGKKQLTIEFKEAISALPKGLDGLDILLADDGRKLVYTFDARADATGITRLLKILSEAKLGFKELQTHQSSLEDIFVDLVNSSSKGIKA